MTDDSTVYVNDYPIGETNVYHDRRSHVTTLNRWRDDYVRETTASEAREDGLRPCKVCFPSDAGASCPACGYPGTDRGRDGTNCENDDCRVVLFGRGNS